jgi:hypothetical protein
MGATITASAELTDLAWFEAKAKAEAKLSGVDS